MGEEKLYWVQVEIGVDSVNPKEAMKKVRQIIGNITKGDFNFLIHKADEDENFITLNDLREEVI